jgi:hypothetical protein
MLKQGKLILIVLALMLVAAVAPAFALEVTVSGTIDEVTNPRDEYSIQVEAGSLVGIALNCVGSTLDPYLEVYGPNGFYRSDDDGGSNSLICIGTSHYSSALSFRAPVSGTYTIVVTSYPIHYNYVGDITSGGNYSLQITGEFTALFNTDSRLNHGYGDLAAVLYAVDDAEGNPAINVYCNTGEPSWSVVLQVTVGSGNASAAGCGVQVFALEGGAYQFNITTDGKLYEILCADLTCADKQLSYFDPNE